MKGKTMNKKQLMYDRINAHGQQLKSIFKLDPNIDPVKLCKQLFKLENKAHRLAEDGCNGVIYDTEPQAEQIVKKVCKILNIPYEADRVFFNGDPRGYALKFTSRYSKYLRSCNINIHQDWGGYGIIAPDFREG
tara:strand:+ start:137 stop:538 length:402 start_codon:yes stop_codon:yes gene_type:complete